MGDTAVEELSPEEVSERLASGHVLLIDVREATEYQAERIPGAFLYPLKTFDPAAIPADDHREVVFHCGSGMRSADAARRCLNAGRAKAAHMSGGLKAWKAAGLKVITIDPATGEPVGA